MQGIQLDADHWMTSGSDVLASLLFPIMSLMAEDEMLQNELDEQGSEGTPNELRQMAIELLPQLTNAIYQFWLSRRQDTDYSSLSKTGRNAPCPCGSGKKYKKCCLN